MSRGVPECELVVCTEEDCDSGGGLEQGDISNSHFQFSSDE